ncbi:MAG: type II 3-dehydroquinate dehydratase [Rhodospirillaceae bacterium]|nr:type II 3-dehydroquinate dehydratase [Rhodospirillaceae bacterium]
MVEKTDILILNGPNLNMLGVREPDIYGHESLNDVEHMCRDRAQLLKMSIDFRQSNFEGELVTIIQKARDNARGIIINPAAYTHTSVAIQDALKLAELPVVELHLSNPHAREPFRHNSYVSPVAAGIICGFGSFGYILAIDAIARLIDSK